MTTEGRAQPQRGRRRPRSKADAVRPVGLAELDLIFDALPDPVAVLDLEHRLVRVNRALASRLDSTPRDLVGRKCDEPILGLDWLLEPSRAVALLDATGVHTAEIAAPRLGGVFAVSSLPRTDAAGRVTGSIHVAHDVTAARRAEEALRASEQRLLMALESAGIGVFDWDVQTGRVLYLDWATAAQDGRRYSETEAWIWATLTSPEDYTAAQVEIEKSLSGLTDDFTTLVLRRSEGIQTGRLHHVRSRGRVVARGPDGRATRVVGTFEDVTDALRREQLERDCEAARVRLATLSRREREVAELLVEGLTSPEMAARLALSVRTVEMHRARLRRRLGAATIAEVVALVFLGREDE